MTNAKKLYKNKKVFLSNLANKEKIKKALLKAFSVFLVFQMPVISFSFNNKKIVPKKLLTKTNQSSSKSNLLAGLGGLAGGSIVTYLFMNKSNKTEDETFSILLIELISGENQSAEKFEQAKRIVSQSGFSNISKNNFLNLIKLIQEIKEKKSNLQIENENKILELNKQIQKFEEEKTNQKEFVESDEINKLKQEVENLKMQIDKQEKLNERQKVLDELAKNLEQQKKECNDLEEKLKLQRKEVDNQAQTLEKKEQTLSEQAQTLEKREQMLNEKEQKLLKEKQNLEDRNKQIRKFEEEKTNQKEFVESDEINKLKQEVESLKMQIDKQEKLNEQQKNLNIMEKDQNQRQKDLDELAKNLEQRKKECNDLEEKLKLQRKEVDNQAQTLKKREQTLNEKEQELLKERQQFEELKNQIDERDKTLIQWEEKLEQQSKELKDQKLNFNANEGKKESTFQKNNEDLEEINQSQKEFQDLLKILKELEKKSNEQQKRLNFQERELKQRQIELDELAEKLEQQEKNIKNSKAQIEQEYQEIEKINKKLSLEVGNKEKMEVLEQQRNKIYEEECRGLFKSFEQQAIKGGTKNEIENLKQQIENLKIRNIEQAEKFDFETLTLKKNQEYYIQQVNELTEENKKFTQEDSHFQNKLLEFKTQTQTLNELKQKQKESNIEIENLKTIKKEIEEQFKNLETQNEEQTEELNRQAKELKNQIQWIELIFGVIQNPEQSRSENVKLSVSKLNLNKDLKDKLLNAIEIINKTLEEKKLLNKTILDLKNQNQIQKINTQNKNQEDSIKQQQKETKENQEESGEETTEGKISKLSRDISSFDEKSKERVEIETLIRNYCLMVRRFFEITGDRHKLFEKLAQQYTKCETQMKKEDFQKLIEKNGLQNYNPKQTFMVTFNETLSFAEKQSRTSLFWWIEKLQVLNLESCNPYQEFAELMKQVMLPLAQEIKEYYNSGMTSELKFLKEKKEKLETYMYKLQNEFGEALEQKALQTNILNSFSCQMPKDLR
jgi:hypothetical protein